MGTTDFDAVFPRLIEMEIFGGFSADSAEDKRILRNVYESFSTRDYKAGDVIVREGEYGDTFFLLLSGRVQVFKDTLSGDTLALANLDAEQHVFFGETALIEQEARSATVKALTDCRTATLSGRKFLEICAAEPSFGFRVLLCLSKRLCIALKKANSDVATLYEALFAEIEGGN